ncbi:glutaredoxin family protein [Kordia sp. YSTF-M3]|uniref:Glutaredoxin family protein n=1 Tax=Kordia aestuariivivens TaxID=2759037 RepID=A0ABR7QAA3_9FLAO|nr:glutaredoxin family protein [Kordia aestuariivivens]MBC8755501.1 glutaredoxin family protein [Kordia aestuariivivens]
MKTIPKIKLFGTAACHKTNYYIDVLNDTEFPYQFLDVNENEAHAEALRNLYENRKLNFPTITIGDKKLRNPRTEELEKWLKKLMI